MNNDHFTPEEQELIDLLQQASQPRLNRGIAEAIHQKMLEEMDKPVPVQIVRRSPIRFLPAAAAAAVVGLVFLFMLLNNWQNLVGTATHVAGQSTATPTDAATATASATLTLTSTAVEPTATLPEATATEAIIIVATDTDVPVIPPTQTDIPPATATDTDIPPATATDTEIPPSKAVPTDTPVMVATATDEPVLPSATPTSILIILSPTPTLETVIILEGMIDQINDNVLTINGLEIEVPSGHPILQLLEVDDQVRIQGGIDDAGTVIASVVDNLVDDAADDATVGVDGPVTEIDDNIVTVNGIRIAFAKDDPLLSRLDVGDFVSIQGNFETRNNRIVLVVVKTEVLAENGTGVPADCWYQSTGMGMGHWRCDENNGMGMGMGMGSTGMGSTGMGNPGMGMGIGSDNPTGNNPGNNPGSGNPGNPGGPGNGNNGMGNSGMGNG